MNRSDRFEPIFEADSDRRMFLRTLAETCRSAGWHAHSFELMRNHYHLLVETQRATLVKGINRSLQQRWHKLETLGL